LPATLATDRFKAEIYTAAGIPVYWIINLAESTIEVFSLPNPSTTPPRYQQATKLSRLDDVPVVVDGRHCARIKAAELLPE
jgi:Uma2 family endonuclease